MLVFRSYDLPPETHVHWYRTVRAVAARWPRYAIVKTKIGLRREVLPEAYRVLRAGMEVRGLEHLDSAILGKLDRALDRESEGGDRKGEGSILGGLGDLLDGR